MLQKVAAAAGGIIALIVAVFAVLPQQMRDDFFIGLGMQATYTPTPTTPPAATVTLTTPTMDAPAAVSFQPTAMPTHTPVPPSPTALPAATPTLPPPTATPAPETVEAQIYRDENSLTLYLTGNQQIWLTGVRYDVLLPDATVESYVLEEYPAFVLFQFMPVQAPACIRLEWDDANDTIEQDCMEVPTNARFTQPLSDADVFWYDRANRTAFEVFLFQGDSLPQRCPPAASACTVILIIEPPALEAVLPTAEPSQAVQPAAPTLLPPAPTAKEYPCAGTIAAAGSMATMLNIVRSVPPPSGVTLNAIRVGTEVNIVERRDTPSNGDWYLIATPEGTWIGWVEGDYLQFAPSCP